MKRILALFACLCLATAQAKDETWMHTEGSWLNTDHPENASFFAPKLRVSRINDSLAVWPGARIGWIVGSVLSIGFEGYMLANEINTEYDKERFSMAVAGVVFEAIPSPEKRTHMVFNLLIGGGGAQVGGGPDLDSLSNHGFFALEPGAGIEFNLTPQVRLSPGISYLWISGYIPGMESKWNASEGALSLTLRFKDPS